MKLQLKGLGLILILIVIAGLLYLKGLPTKVFSKGVISGVINLNGEAPDKSTIAIGARKIGASQYEIVVSGIETKDGASWSWKGAEEGVTYEIEGYLESDGVSIGQSNTARVASPATDEILTFNHSRHSDETASISGIIDINGSIPSGGTVAIAQRRRGEKVFSIAVSGIQAVDGANWEWKDAQKGSIYEIKALFRLNNTDFAESRDLLTVSVPAVNEILTINLPTPTKTPVIPTSATISGKIDLNGSVPSNSSISLGQKVHGQSSFNIAVTGLSAVNGVTWSWNGSQAGVTYDLQAYLLANNQAISSSEIETVAAPAVNEELTINIYSNLPIPPNSPGVQCQGKGANGNWNTTISYHSVNGAALYWVKVGDVNQDNKFLDSRIPPNNQQLPTTYNFNTDYLFTEGVTYYVKYAYSPCATCSDAYNFSLFTSPTQFTCTTTPPLTSYPTQPPPPTNTPIPPTPTLPPKTARCNETCGSNGYTCVLGLQCISGSMPGATVCRNPNCTDKTDCKCI